MRYETARAILSEAIERLDEATSPYGYKRVGGKKGKRGRMIGGRFVPVTKKEHEERVAKSNTNWSEVNRNSREHARSIDRMYEAIEQLTLDEGTRRAARLSAALYKAQKRGEKAGPGSALGRAASRARAKYGRSEDRREGNPEAIENRMKWQKKYPGPSQPRGFGSWGF